MRRGWFYNRRAIDCLCITASLIFGGVCGALDQPWIFATGLVCFVLGFLYCASFD